MRAVVASDPRIAQTVVAEWAAALCDGGVVRLPWRSGRNRGRVTNLPPSRAPLERAAGAGDSPVGERCGDSGVEREYRRARAIRREAGSTTIQG